MIKDIMAEKTTTPIIFGLKEKKKAGNVTHLAIGVNGVHVGDVILKGDELTEFMSRLKPEVYFDVKGEVVKPVEEKSNGRSRDPKHKENK